MVGLEGTLCSLHSRTLPARVPSIAHLPVHASPTTHCMRSVNLLMHETLHYYASLAMRTCTICKHRTNTVPRQQFIAQKGPATRPEHGAWLYMTMSQSLLTIKSKECQRRKVKCDGMSPCARCLGQSFACTYVTPNQRASTTHRYIKQVSVSLRLTGSCVEVTHIRTLVAIQRGRNGLLQLILMALQRRQPLNLAVRLLHLRRGLKQIEERLAWLCISLR